MRCLANRVTDHLAYLYDSQFIDHLNLKALEPAPVQHFNFNISCYFFVEVNGPGDAPGVVGVLGPEEKAPALLDEEDAAPLLDREGSISSTCNKWYLLPAWHTRWYDQFR